ncbi:MFS transporter [Bacillus sp. B15-48]|uniref:MFS transporter n=1 Tax=Bacillus sp. B15-48 TaxID=1548601 RepID=UPI00193F7F97|nr:MFS transporter [Bacillus sp. B15-48]MBM4761237.1 MFS transporter [Bacillus sp. B15-48]
MGSQAQLENPKGNASKVSIVGLTISLFLCVLTYQFNISMVTPALPNIAASLNVGIDRVSQVSSLLLLVSSISGVILARWSDFIGRRRALYLVLFLMGFGSFLCMIAPNFTVLMIGRMFQGAIGAAFQLCYVILKETVSPKTFGILLGILTSANGGLAGIDGYLGGLISDNFGFRFIFVVILAVGLIAFFGVKSNVPETRKGETKGKMDWWGAAVISIVLICLSTFVSQGSTVGWFAPITLIYLLGTIVAMVAFWFIEKNSEFPLFPVEHLRSRQVWPVLTTTVLSLSGLFAVINFTIIMLSQNQSVGFGFSAATTGLMFLMPGAIIGLFSAPLSGWLAGKVGWIRLIRIGLAVNIAILIVLAVFWQNQWMVFAAVVAMGFTYNGVILTTVNGLGVIQSPDEAPSALPALNGAAFGIGASLGFAFVAPFVAQGDFSTGFGISVGFIVLALISSLFIVQKQEQKN